jgi:GntR family transcriptional regulator
MKNQTPTSKRLHETLGKMIDSLETGDRLPSEPELARQLSVSRATLREVMRTFETQGLLHRRQGAGTFVSRPSQVIDSGIEVLESIETIARRIGLPVALGERRLEIQPADETEQSVLGLSPGAQVLHAARVILAEGQPAAYLIDILSADFLSAEELQESFSGSVLDLLLKRSDLSLDNSRCEINAVTASPEIARAMGIQRGDVLLRFEARLYDRSGKVIVYSFSYFLPGHFRFHVVRRVGGPD